MNAIPNAKTALPATRPSGVWTSPMIVRPTAATTRRARQPCRADLVGELREHEPQHDHERGVDRQRHRRAGHADLFRVERHEREVAGHAPCPEEDEQARKQPGRVEQPNPDPLHRRSRPRARQGPFRAPRATGPPRRS